MRRPPEKKWTGCIVQRKTLACHHKRRMEKSFGWTGQHEEGSELIVSRAMVLERNDQSGVGNGTKADRVFVNL
jgi:hypothetical protein